LKSFISFAKPDIGNEEIEEVVNTMKSGWLTTGPKVKQFESNFSDFLGNNKLNALAVNSATSGLHLSLEAIGIKPGDEVITTTHTFAATAEVIIYMGATPIFVDVDPDTLCINPSLIESKITKKTKAIIPVHFAGLSSEMNQILKIAKKYNLKVIEDAAHALPTTYNQKLIGTLKSDLTVFSFYANKTMTTGEGGMIITRNSEYAKRIRTMRLHGINRDVFDRFTSRKANWEYDIIGPGYKYNMTDVAAAIGIHQLKKLNMLQAKRERIADIFSREFRNIPLKLPNFPKNKDKHSWHLYVIRLLDESKIKRDELIKRLTNLGIGTSVHYKPLHLHSYWKNNFKLEKTSFPNSQKAFENSISLPIYSRMNDNDIEKVYKSVISCLS